MDSTIEIAKRIVNFRVPFPTGRPTVSGLIMKNCTHTANTFRERKGKESEIHSEEAKRIEKEFRAERRYQKAFVTKVLPENLPKRLSNTFF